MPKIKLITIDIDGTLYPEKGKVMDPDHIAGFQKAVRRFLEDPDAPVPVICTGKPAAYVEGFAEAYGLVDAPKEKPMSHVCEAGAEVFVYNNWQHKRYIKLPDLFSKHDIKDKMRHIENLIKEKTRCTKEEGKSTSLSFNPPEGKSVQELYNEIREVIQDHLGYKVLGMENVGMLSETVHEITGMMKNNASIEDIKKLVVKKEIDFFITHSSTAVDISAFPTGKSLGIAYIASIIQKVGFDEMMAIGDTAGDHPAFELAGIPVGVANSSQQTAAFVKAKGGLITKRPSIQGVTDVLDLVYRYRNIEDIMRNKEDVFQ
ncbi:HAD hydrolase family protein [Candidatus Woesearchaeota archaeon]|nr:HAD hydrolase family protein [Candidatus Woesearchaeota archaeon]